ncbi:hypothetical protein BKA70DRAFT_1405446 [Coprinopsis sp. MPI-PUGE-AT-0042]|nr:hypothetical protein BKA70DRAFT_1405446 [Coprinopsis sp. MPI-PUGE-AT-0042]
MPLWAIAFNQNRDLSRTSKWKVLSDSPERCTLYEAQPRAQRRPCGVETCFKTTQNALRILAAVDTELHPLSTKRDVASSFSCSPSPILLDEQSSNSLNYGRGGTYEIGRNDEGRLVELLSDLGHCTNTFVQVRVDFQILSVEAETLHKAAHKVDCLLLSALPAQILERENDRCMLRRWILIGWEDPLPEDSSKITSPTTVANGGPGSAIPGPYPAPVLPFRKPERYSESRSARGPV